MYQLTRLRELRELDLSYNGILTIEALKECIHLTHLNLEGNSIKTIEHLNTNLKLEFLNLGENSIGIVSDISFLKQLKVRSAVPSFIYCSAQTRLVLVVLFSLSMFAHSLASPNYRIIKSCLISGALSSLKSYFAPQERRQILAYFS